LIDQLLELADNDVLSLFLNIIFLLPFCQESSNFIFWVLLFFQYFNSGKVLNIFPSYHYNIGATKGIFLLGFY